MDEEARRHTFYRRGTGPGVIVIHEIPGITPHVLAFADGLVRKGFTVLMPVLLGTPGKPSGQVYGACQLARACVSREFATWLTNRSSPATVWLRQLARALHEELDGPGVGVVGMCLTGGFALAMVLEPAVVAPVLSQPSLPFPLNRRHREDVNLSVDERKQVVERVETDNLTVLGLRFSMDRKAPKERFAALHALLGPRFADHTIESGPGTPFPKGAHSVLTYSREQRSQQELDAAAERVATLLADRLKAQT